MATTILGGRIMSIITTELLQLNILIFSLGQMLNCSFPCFTGKPFLPKVVLAPWGLVLQWKQHIVPPHRQLCRCIPLLWLSVRINRKIICTKILQSFKDDFGHQFTEPMPWKDGPLERDDYKEKGLISRKVFQNGSRHIFNRKNKLLIFSWQFTPLVGFTGAR